MASVQDRSVPGEARFRVRWRDGRASPARSYTFSCPAPVRGTSDAARAAGRLKAYVDLMGHHLSVLEALIGAGFRVEGVPLAAEPATPMVTVAEFAERWLGMLTRANPRTRADYERILRRHVLPALGALDVAVVNPEHVARWVREQEASPTGRGAGGCPRPPSAKSVAHRHAILSSLLDAAARLGLRTGNPARGLGPPPRSMHREMCFLTPAEWALLHRALHRPGGGPYARFGQDLATLLVGSGMRFSEATALSTGQCDLLAPRAIVRIDRAFKRQPDGSYQVGEPKSRRGVRSVDVPEQLRDLLIRLTAGKEHDELVFTAPRGGQYLSSWFYDRYWAPALARAAEHGLRKRPRVHDLRHTHAAWLIAEGRPLPSIQARLGHESITTTIDRYGHLMPDLDAGNAAAIGRALALTDPAGPAAAAEPADRRV